MGCEQQTNVDARESFDCMLESVEKVEGKKVKTRKDEWVREAHHPTKICKKLYVCKK